MIHSGSSHRLGAVGTINRSPFEQVGNLHQLMHDNEHPPGNMAVLVNATEPGQLDIEL